MRIIRPDLTHKTHGSPAKPIGLGDAVSAIATPIARALGMDCVDEESGQLKPDSPCGRHAQALNEAMPDVLRPLSG